MTATESKHGTSFIVFFSVIALLINGVQYRSMEQARLARQQELQHQQQIQQEEQRQAQQRAADQEAAAEHAKEIKDAEAARKQAAQDAAAEHSRYLARYLNPGFSRKAGIETVAVAVASEDGTFNQAVTRALANHLNTGTVETLPSFFKPEFVSDGLINDDFAAARSELPEKLELTNSLDGLLLAHQSVEYSSNPSLENVLTATMQLKVVAISLVGNMKGQTWTFTAVGAGFKEADARAMAEERLIKQINADTNVSLAQISANIPNQ